MEKEDQQQPILESTTPKKEDPEITLEEKVSNLLGGSIPHLEAIIHSSKPKDKYTVRKKNIDFLFVNKNQSRSRTKFLKKLAICQKSL